jgi:CubicO group peptidase (beta-lactamase class C family)
MIVKDTTVMFRKAYGKANYELNVPMNSDTKFRIASVSKTFTAAAIVMLANQGKIKYVDNLSTYIPGFIQGDSITIAHLLLHQSGMADIDYDKYAFEKIVKKGSI